MASRKLLKLYCPYLNRSNSAEIRLSSINLNFRVQTAQVSSLTIPAPSSSPQIPQKYWDQISQPPTSSSKGKGLLIQNIVTAIEICGMLVNSSSKTFWCFPNDALVQQNIKSWSRESWSGGKLISWELIWWQLISWELIWWQLISWELISWHQVHM